MRSLPGVAQPPAQLKGLAHITLAPGRSARVGFRLDARALSYWDAGASVWRVAAGCYGVMVGSSSRDHPLRALLAEGGARCTRRGAGRAL
jgi:beta-glucosidase